MQPFARCASVRRCLDHRQPTEYPERSVEMSDASDYEDDTAPEVAEDDTAPEVAEDDTAPEVAEDDTAPEVAEDDTAPEVAEDDTAPEVAEDDTAPEVAEDDTAPEVAEDDTAPEVAEDDTAPEVAEDDTAPEVAEDDTAPEVAEDDTAPEVAEDDTAPEVAEDDTAPEVAEDDTAPEVAEDDTAPEVAEDDTAPEVAEDDTAPEVAEDDTAPEVAEDDTAPEVAEDDTAPEVAEDDTAPEVAEDDTAPEVAEDDTAPEVAEDDTAPEVAEDDTAPEVAEDDTAPEVAEDDTAPEVAENDTAPEVAEDDTAPEVAEDDTAPEVAEDDTAPEVAEDDTAPEVAEDDTAPEVAEDDTAPEVAEDDTAPEVAEDDTAPEVAEDDTAPEVAEDDTAPEVAEDDTAPEVAEDDTAPEVAEDDTAPEVAEDDTAPEVAEDDTAPEVAEDDTAPEVAEDDTAPEVAEDDTAPEVAEDDTAPEVAENDTAPEVAENDTAPEVAEDDTAPEVAEGDLSGAGSNQPGESELFSRENSVDPLADSELGEPEPFEPPLDPNAGHRDGNGQHLKSKVGSDSSDAHDVEPHSEADQIGLELRSPYEMRFEALSPSEEPLGDFPADHGKPRPPHGLSSDPGQIGLADRSGGSPDSELLRTGDHLLDTQDLFDKGKEVDGGRAFFDVDDPTMKAAERLGEFPGTRKYDLHGTWNDVNIGGKDLTPSQFAAVIRADPEWVGQPITLFSCDTGKDGPNGEPSFAQRLSDELGVPVTAPTELAWSNGEPFSSSGKRDAFNNLSPTHPPDGEFLTFKPIGESGVTREPVPAGLHHRQSLKPELSDGVWRGYSGAESGSSPVLTGQPEPGQGDFEAIYAGKGANTTSEWSPTNSSRGLSDSGGVIEQSDRNAAGGRIFTSTGTIRQKDFTSIVNSGLMQGEHVTILTGGHGLPNGEIVADQSLFDDDRARFGSMPGVTVLDVTKMTNEERDLAMNRPGMIIGGFCNSRACLPLGE